jgi:hypothetical protein
MYNLKYLFLNIVETGSRINLEGHSHKKVCEIIALNKSLGHKKGPTTYLKFLK